MKHALAVLLVVIVAGVSYVLLQQGLQADEVRPADKGTLSVLVSDGVGAPLENASVTFTLIETSKATTINQKNELGFYSADLVAGTYTVTAQAEGYIVDTQTILLDPKQSRDLTFYLVAQE